METKTEPKTLVSRYIKATSIHSCVCCDEKTRYLDFDDPTYHYSFCPRSVATFKLEGLLLEVITELKKWLEDWLEEDGYGEITAPLKAFEVELSEVEEKQQKAISLQSMHGVKL
jgi:hypothetical protein